MATQKDLTAGKKAAAVASVNDWIKVGSPAVHSAFCCSAVPWGGIVLTEWVLRGVPSKQLLVWQLERIRRLPFVPFN